MRICMFVSVPLAKVNVGPSTPEMVVVLPVEAIVIDPGVEVVMVMFDPATKLVSRASVPDLSGKV